MADTTTELEVLNQIVDVLGGQSGQYETVVPVLQQIKELLEAGITDPEAIAEAVSAWLDEHPEATTTVQDGSITGVKIADNTIPDAKLAQTGGVLEKVDSIFSETPVATSIREIAGATAYMGHNGTTNISPSGISIATVTPGYDSYLLVTTQDMNIWFDTVSVNYLALTWGTAYTETVANGSGTGVIAKCSNPVRLRKNDGNLPTEQNKLHVPAGSAVCFTLPQNKEQTVYGFASETVVRETFAVDVMEYGKMRLKALYDSVGGYLDVYIPTKVGYVDYRMAHVDNNSTNANIWHMSKAVAVADSLAERFDMTTGGEWEVAVHLKDRDDFSGGSAHGDQVIVGTPLVMVDGAIVSLSNLSTLTECSELVFVQTSNLYDPADHETIIAIEACQHRFTIDGLETKQSLVWQGAYDITASYMAMFPPAKEVTDYAYLDSDMTPKVCASVYGNHVDTTWCCLYGASNGVRMEFWVTENPDKSGKKFFMTDNGNMPYNKCYYYASSGNNTVAADELWKATTHYRIEVGA